MNTLELRFLNIRRLASLFAITVFCFPAWGVDITFDGGAGQVGGSCAVVENEQGRLLVDCGTFYGAEAGPGDKSETGEFSFDPKTIDALLVTHAHADHTGRIPQLVRSGFKGRIYMTPPTFALLRIALKSQALYDDSYVRDWAWSDKSDKGQVHWRKECEWRGKIHRRNLNTFRGRYSDLKKALKDDSDLHDRDELSGCKVCSELDVASCLKYATMVGYEEKLDLNGFTVVFRPVEHLPGSAAIYFYDDSTSFVFSGDLGTWRSRTAAPVPVSSKVDAVFMECTYGDKARAGVEKTKREYDHFAQVVATALSQGKLVWIPAFAMDRTQRVMLELAHAGVRPANLYSLSSSGNAMTSYYIAHPELFPDEATRLWPALAAMHRKAEVMFAPGVSPRRSSVLLTTAGMMDSGASCKFLPKLLPDPDVVVCLVGYQSPGTPGAQLKSGKKTVTMHNGGKIPVRATVESFDCFSGHGDARENDKWLGDNVRSKIYLIQGEKDALEERKRGLETRFGADVEIVERKRTYHLGPTSTK